MNALENRLFAFMARWNNNRIWRKISRNSRESFAKFLNGIYSTLSSCGFIAFIVFTTKDLNPAGVLIMESCLFASKSILTDWKCLKEAAVNFWQTADFVKAFLEIEEREIGLVECASNSKEIAIKIEKGQFYWPYVSEIVGKTKKHSEVLSRC